MATVTLAADIAPEITAGINAAGAIVKLTDDELGYLNSPTMVQARKNRALIADQDRARKDAANALKTGDANEVNKDLA